MLLLPVVAALACSTPDEPTVRAAGTHDDPDGSSDTAPVDTGSDTAPVDTGADTGPHDTGADAVHVSADTLLALTTSCDQLAGTDLFAKDDGGRETIPMCGLDGAVWFTADMDVDCDGGSSAACRGDPYYQPETSAVDSHGDPLDASHLPFAVLPLDSNGFSMSAQGLHLGSVVAVVYHSQLAWAVVGDRGPTGAVGEGSYALADELGIDPDPETGGAESGVTWIFFTGSDAVVDPIESTSGAETVGEAQATALLKDNR